MKIYFNLLFFLFLLYPHVSANDLSNNVKPKYSGLFRGEELTYEVSWLSIKIGTIKVMVNENEGSNSSYSTIAFIDSYPGLPFADVHAIFKGIMDEHAVSQSFIGLDKEKNGEWSVLKYDYNKTRTEVVINKGVAKNFNDYTIIYNPIDTLWIDLLTQDGLSVFYFARQQLRSLDTFSVKTIVQGKAGTTELNCYGKQSDVEIHAVKYPVDVVELNGMAKFKGVFGLTGEFKGWFSNDDAHIPIRAQLGVIIGNVNLELISWKRGGWMPPEYYKRVYGQ